MRPVSAEHAGSDPAPLVVALQCDEFGFGVAYERRARAQIESLLASPRYRVYRWVSRIRRCFALA